MHSTNVDVIIIFSIKMYVKEFRKITNTMTIGRYS